MAAIYVGGPRLVYFQRRITPMTCPNCRMNIYPIIKVKPSTKTHIACLIMSLLGCCICAPCVYLNKDCLAHECYCPLCNRHLGTFD